MDAVTDETVKGWSADSKSAAELASRAASFVDVGDIDNAELSAVALASIALSLSVVAGVLMASIDDEASR